MTLQKNVSLNIISTHKAATSLGLKSAEFTELLNINNIVKTKNSKGKWSIKGEDYILLKQLMKDRYKQQKNVQANLSREKTEHDNELYAQIGALKADIKNNVTVNTNKRVTPPHKSVLFVGPTNSGKTYHGLEELFRDYENNPTETHTYCGPLRLLAYEVYNKMVARYGEDKVGFITGEESINPTAKLLATTAEMAPMEGNSILIDEAHWLAEPSRGHIWTKLLYTSEYKNIYSLTAGEAVPLVEKLTSDAWFTQTNRFERKTPIVYKGTLNIEKVAPKTAIVCFSRKGVYAVANFLIKKGHKVGVLYGGLPLKARKRQIEAYLEGKYDVMVVTDVIGHGINLPIDNVVFTQTEKFDGSDVRPIHIWEGAQIAGRAGRYGLSEEGSVYLGEGLDWFSKDKEIVKLSVLAAGGKTGTDLEVDTALLSPKLNDLGLNVEGGVTELSKMLPAIYQWQTKVLHTVKDEPLEPSSLSVLTKNVETILHTLKIPTAPWNESKPLEENCYPKGMTVDVNEIWQLGSGPYDTNLPTIVQIAEWLVSPYRNESNRLLTFFNETILSVYKNMKSLPLKEAAQQIESLEEIVHINAELKMAMTMFGTTVGEETFLGLLPKNVLTQLDDNINTLIINILMLGITNSKIGVCITCDDNTAPWFKECDPCHIKRKALLKTTNGVRRKK